MIRVVLADDHPLVRQGLRAVFESTADIRVVAEADSGAAAVRACVEHQADVVLMDLQMPDLHGIEATRQVREKAPSTRVLVLTMFDDDDTVFAAVSAGASGYLLKGSDGADIVSAVRAAAAGQAVFGTVLAQRMQTWFTAAPKTDVYPFPDLTEREREILDGIAAGLTNSQIGSELFLSPKTVANNVTVILTKLGVQTRSGAIVKARETGLGRRAHDETADRGRWDRG